MNAENEGRGGAAPPPRPAPLRQCAASLEELETRYSERWLGMRERFYSRQSRMKATWRKERERTAARRKWIGKKRKTRREIRGLSERAALSRENQGGDWNVKFFNISYSTIFQFRQLLTWPRFPPILSIGWEKRRSPGDEKFFSIWKRNLASFDSLVFFSSLRASLIFIVSALCVSQFLVLC